MAGAWGAAPRPATQGDGITHQNHRGWWPCAVLAVTGLRLRDLELAGGLRIHESHLPGIAADTVTTVSMVSVTQRYDQTHYGYRGGQWTTVA